jgi:hypothetical protein
MKTLLAGQPVFFCAILSYPLSFAAQVFEKATKARLLKCASAGAAAAADNWAAGREGGRAELTGERKRDEKKRREEEEEGH